MRQNDFQASRRAAMAARLREVREDFYGEHGSQFWADELGIPMETWLNYEQGIIVPAEIALKLLVFTSVCAEWLLTGEGEKYDPRARKNADVSYVI
jgi:hypothetical protein